MTFNAAERCFGFVRSAEASRALCATPTWRCSIVWCGRSVHVLAAHLRGRYDCRLQISKMATAVRTTLRQVRPILSVNPQDARSRVLSLYKAWYRQIPYIVVDYDIPKNAKQCREKLREEFMKNANIRDIRIIDLLVIKGQMELKETVQIWKQKGTLMNYFKDTVEKKPTDFLSKFLSGHD